MKGSPDLDVFTWSHPGLKAVLYPERQKPPLVYCRVKSPCELCPFFSPPEYSILVCILGLLILLFYSFHLYLLFVSG